MIIVGFGRFGQIVGRLLYANKIKVTILESDASQVRLLRKYGYKVFYGMLPIWNYYAPRVLSKQRPWWFVPMTLSK